MKKLFIILFLILVGVIIFLYFKNKEVVITQVFNNVKNEESIIKEDVLKNQKQIGDIIVNYPDNTQIFIDKINNLDLSLKINSFSFNESSNKKEKRDYSFLNFLYFKNENPERLTIEKWFEDNNPESEKQSPYSVISSEKINIDGREALKVYFYASDYISGGYYNLMSIYIPNKTDIYEIQGYKLPSKPDPALTEDDIKSAKEYEKIVDQIVQSIHFVK
jgi:hypothetical protein